MTADDALRAHDPEIALFGRLLASAAHDLRNVLSVIREVGGLIQDHLAVMTPGTPMPAEVLAQIEKRISNQSGRGVEILDALGRLAHSADPGREPVDLDEIASTVCTLLGHRAARKGIALQLAPRGCPVLARWNRLGALVVVDRIVTRLIESPAVEGLPIAVGAHRDGRDAVLRFETAAFLEDLPSDAKSVGMEDELAPTPARLEVTTERGRGTEVELRISRSESPDGARHEEGRS